MTKHIVLKALLEEKGLNQTEVAKLLGISRTALNQKLNGKNDFLSEELSKLSKLLGVDPEIFFTRKVSNLITKNVFTRTNK